LNVADKGYAVCQATWGDYWEEIEGQRMFSCCGVWVLNSRK
jgi:hypothetical protein